MGAVLFESRDPNVHRIDRIQSGQRMIKIAAERKKGKKLRERGKSATTSCIRKNFNLRSCDLAGGRWAK